VLALADPKKKRQNSVPCLMVRRGTTSTGICHHSFKYWYISLFSLSYPPLRPIQVRLLLQLPRVPVHLLDDALDVHGVAVEIHLLAVLCHEAMQSALLFNWVGRGGDRGTGDVLNLMYKLLGVADVRGSNSVVMAIPSERAPGGRRVRKSRAALARGEKGLKRVVT